MSKDKGFTLIEVLIAIAIFSLVSTLIFYAFSQSLSLWERADKEAEKMDQLIFVNTWIKDVFHSAENLELDLQGQRTPLFIGTKERVLFLSSNPVLDRRKVTSIVRIEIRPGGIFYAEDHLFKRGISLDGLPAMDFDKEYPLLAGAEDGRLSYLIIENASLVWKDEVDAGKSRAVPKAVKIEFFYKGKKMEIVSYILSNAKDREPLRRILF